MSENNSVTQSGRDPKTGQFLQGISGNPAGRSSRNKLSEQFISDFYDEWQKSGANVLKTVAETDPVAFMR